jgi:phage baseplate assembly protein V
MSRILSDLNRRLDNLLGLGTIAEVDFAARPPMVRLDLSGRLTDWRPIPAEIGANFRRWRPLRVGTQVLVACPSGDPANAVIVQILYTDSLAPPSTAENVDLIEWNDGTVVRHDSTARVTTIASPDGTLVLDAKNVVIRTGENGYFQFDHAGKVTRLTHKGGCQFDSEAWDAGAVVVGKPDNGFSPPKVVSPGEDS